MSGGETELALTEDQRVAATIPAGISNYVGTSALAVLAGATALFTYVSQQFAPPTSFDVVMALGAFVLVASIFFGGVGSTRVTGQIADGTWSHNDRVCAYNLQAILTLGGLALVLAATVIGTTAPLRKDNTDHRLDKLESEVKALK
jgi:hypothetical protein